MQVLAVGHAFDCLDGLALGLNTQNQTGADQTTIQCHAACAAVTCAAPFFCTRHVQVIAQHIEKRLISGAQKLNWITVNNGCYVML
jgi:hypothetical protein